MEWGPNWYPLANGMGIYLPEARPCLCGETEKVVTRDAASCPNCKAKKLQGQRVLARLDCSSGVVTEEPRRR